MPPYSVHENRIPVSIAAIQAQKLVYHTRPRRLTDMDKLTQAQMVLSLRSYGEEPPKDWSKVQLLSRLKELEEAGEVIAPHGGTKKHTPLELAIKDLNKAGARKATLQKYVTDTCQITITGNETMTILQQKAMGHLLQVTTPVGEDKMGFGKYAAQTYTTVRQNDPQYCSWATETAREGECSQYLKRFVKWLQMRPEETKHNKVDLNKVVPHAKAKSNPKKPGTDDPTTDKTGYPTTTSPATSSTSQDAVVQQLVNAVTALAKEVQDLKNDKAEKPRKIAAKTDCEMEEKPHQDCLHYLQEGWVQYFGHPRCLRLDPAGAFRSAAVEAWCDKHSIFLDIIPGEAHWKVGVVENAVRGVKDVMTKLCQYEPELSPSEALAAAVTTFNHKELVRGYSPAQHILGQAPDETGRFIPATGSVHPGLLVENPNGELERSVRLRAEAEKALSDWNASQRLMRAQHSRHRPKYDYIPGELVFYWRTQDANKGRRQPGGKHGRFLGPARILATETRQTPDGGVQPGGAVWLVKGRSLLKCSPEQLRRATEREELLEALSDPTDQQLTWTYHAVAKEIGGNRFEDLTQDVPDMQEWHRAQDPREEAQPTRVRLKSKRPPPEAPAAVPMEEDDKELIPDRPRRERSRSRGHGSSTAAPSRELPSAWWNNVAERHWPEQKCNYWDDSSAAVAVEIEMPGTQRGSDRAFRDLGAYFIGSMKRRAVELSERKMSPEEKEAFRGAKAIEVKNFVASKAFEVLPEHMKPARHQAIGMRWILTWKLKEDGTRKAKARAVLLGYQDEAYEHRSTTSPVMTRQTRQLLLQLAAWKRWKVQKGDVTGAFLQSRTYPDQLYCIPCPEICHALNIPEGSVTKVQKACYGLVDAPLEWYRSVDTFLRELGFTKLWSDPCCWVLRTGEELRGAISGHVDDFLFSGPEGDELWESKLRAIKEKFKWGDWEAGKFTQCGVVIEQTKEGFELSQPSYLENLHEINVNASRKKDRSQATNDKEKTQLRALLGGISWHAQQVAPYLAAEVSLLLTEVSRSTIDTIVRANLLLENAKSRQKQKMKVHSFAKDDELTMVMWVEAANANRIDGGSTQGLFLGMTSKSMLKGEVTAVTPVAWHSQKIDRACRSPGAAEAQAAVNGEDSLYSGRHQWSELLYGSGSLKAPDELVRKTGGCLVTDSRNVYDRLVTEVMVIKGAEKRTSIELLAIKESQMTTKVELRWVHSEAQLANSLTKQGGHREYDLFYRMNHRWRLVEDESMMSAKRRKDLGLAPLQNQDPPKVSQGCVSEFPTE
ncbi:Copia protein [Symbiodinium microadriaticum]|uniref:Copia protein n=1 Tax=Symbiodinium microadriaticum TaxID=2951 RepID=A0A1Q9E185_SYMMI|nr:Copia protein [Symbiodinium microadriaticum]